MSFGKSDPPPAPDYVGAAYAQGAANEEAARIAGQLNNPNVYNPLGQREITFEGDQPTIVESLTPEGQNLFDQQMRISTSFGNVAESGLGRVNQSLGQEFDPSQLPEISSGVTERDLVTQSILDRYQPTMDEQRQRQEEALLLQGQGRGGAAWNTAQRDLAQQENDARLAAILAGGQEQSRLYEMESNNRNRALQEALALRQLPLSEVNALRTGSQPTLPQFQPYQGQAVGAAPLFDATQAQYNAQLGAVNAQNAQAGQTFGTIGQLGSALFSFSDRRLKRNIKKIGDYLGLPVYLFKYLWSDNWNIGWMADEVMEKYPERVKQHESGYLMVNYGGL